jgi:hypothetical protein
MNEDASMPQAPPPPPPPPATAAKMYNSGGTQTIPKFRNTMHSQTSPEPQLKHSGPPPPQPPPPPAAGAAQTIDPIMDEHLEKQYEYAQAQMSQNENNHKLTRDLLQRSMAAHLGPQGTTNVLQQQFITQVMQGKATSSAPPPADPVTTGGSHNPKPPPPPAGARIIASTAGAPRKPETYRIATRSRSVPRQPKAPKPDPPDIEPMTTDSQQKRGRVKLGEEAIKVKRRITSKSAPPTSQKAVAPKAAPKIMEAETQQKRFAKDEPTGSGPTKKIAKANEEVFDLPKTVAKKAAPPADSKPKNPQPRRAAKPPPKISGPDDTPTPPPPPPPPPTAPPDGKKTRTRKVIKKDKVVDPATATLNMVIKELIKAKAKDQLTEAQVKQFETLVAQLKTKNGPAEVKSKMQAQLRTLYRTEVYGK